MGNGAASAMALTPRATAPEPPTYFVWQPPNKSISVRILPEVLSEIARRSAGDSPEGGGLLLGTVRYAGSYTVTIESIDGIEGRFWRGFSQSHENPERRRFEVALARWRPGADRPLAAVGYFRTERAEAALGPGNDDLMLIARYFSAPHNVFLFVHPAREGAAATAGLVCWQFGQIPETAQEEFALEAPPFALAAATPQLPGPAPVAFPERLEAAPAAIAVRRLWLIGALIGLLLLAVVGGGYLLTRGMPGWRAASPPATVVSPLSLTAERSGADYRVTWDRNATSVLFATKGLLTIADGGTSRVVDLDVSQLKGGSLLYTPGSGDVLIQLEVLGKGPAVTESVRVLAPVGQDTAQPAPLVIKPVPAATRGTEGTAPVRAAPEPPPLVPTRAFTPPASSSSASVAAPPDMAAAPAVQWSTPTISVPTEPPPAERPPAEQPAATPPAPRRVSEYRPPRPIEQPRPVINQVARQALMSVGNSAVQVNVEIVIDRTGRVSTIKPFVGTNPAHKRLWVVAADAVRRWKFEPARLNDEVVESPMTLTFRFGESGSR